MAAINSAATERDVARERGPLQDETGVVGKIGLVGEFVTGERHEEPFVTAEVGLGGFVANREFLAHLVVEVFQQLAARLSHGLVNLQAEFELELVEGGLDFVGLTAALVDGGDALLEIHAGFDGAVSG